MNVIIASTGFMPSLSDCIRSFSARSNCPVHIIADRSVVGHVSASFADYDLGPASKQLVEWGHFPTLRWLATNAYVKARHINGPLFCPDWDLMCFSDLNIACEPFLKFDVCQTRDMGPGRLNEGNWAAASFVGNVEVLDAFCDYATKVVTTKPWGTNHCAYNDMAVWSYFVGESKVIRGDMSEIKNGSVFDHNVCVPDLYEVENDDGGFPTKRIFWKNGRPHFSRSGDSQLIQAHTIHCWGSYKQRTHELLLRAGIA